MKLEWINKLDENLIKYENGYLWVPICHVLVFGITTHKFLQQKTRDAD